MSKDVFICTFANESYIQHACVMLKSITYVRNISRKYSAFLFYSDCADSILNKVSNEFSSEKDFKLRFIKCDNYKKYSSKLKLNHTSMSIYAKVFIYDLLPADVKKVIFFDADIVLLHDPGELYDIDINNYYVGAVQDSYFNKVPLEMKQALKLNSDNDYFNSGVMIVNVDLWKKGKIAERSIKFMLEHGHKTLFHDQDGFNYSIKGQWKRLEPFWNPSSMNTIKDQNGNTLEITYNEIYQKGLGKLVHYYGSNKPWLFMSDHIMKDKYWEVLQKTKFSNYLFPDKTFINIVKKAFLNFTKLLAVIKKRIYQNKLL